MSYIDVRLVTVLLCVGLLSACAGVQAPADPGGPLSAGEAEAGTSAPAAESESEPEMSTRDRWHSPFAVSGESVPVIRGARMVVVVAADSAFSDAMAEVEAGSPADSMSDDNGQADDIALLERDGDLLDDGDASSPAASRSADAPAPGVPHRVETGETWSRILVRYRLTEGELAAANPDVDPNRLEVGQILRIPVGPAESPMRSHRVGRGETLRGIARRYDVAADEIRDLNGMPDERIQAGQVLLIPGGSVTTGGDNGR